MERNPFAPKFDDLPPVLPIFPLTGVLLLPGGQLPLNIFEPRYLDMINAALATNNRLIGMIQPNPMQTARSKAEKTPLHKIGCAGKITEFCETNDGRYIINLTGVARFAVKEELSATSRYRQIAPDWSPFQEDLKSQACLDLNRDHLHDLLKEYFAKESLDCDWSAVESTSDSKLITCLSMICPFDALEKQALLEAECNVTRGKMFIAMLEMALSVNKNRIDTQH
jgi:Lon protease-like protein